MTVDTSFILPEAPPPNPARREAAIGAALNRYDGVDQPSVSKSQPRASGLLQRPQARWLVTASLVAVIGLPAALIAIRGGQFGPSPEATAPVAPSAEASPDMMTTEKQPAERIPFAPVAEAPETPPELSKEAKTDATSVAEAELADVGAPAVAIAPPAPPPPPASPPAAAPPAAVARAPMAQKSTAEDQQIVVTGSRLRRPNLESSAPVHVIGDERRSASPDWVQEDRAYRIFLKQLQSAVRNDDRNGVLRLVAFPLRVNSGGRSRTYRNVGAALADYDRIFTPSVRQAIVDQRFETLFGRDQGVMIGDGAVWFDHTCRNGQCSPPGPVRIKAINN